MKALRFYSLLALLLIGGSMLVVSEFKRRALVNSANELRASIRISPSRRSDPNSSASPGDKATGARNGQPISQQAASIEGSSTFAPIQSMPWDQTPTEWPHWDPESPYAWIEKKALLRLSLGETAFDSDGRLSDATRDLLGLDLHEATMMDELLGRALQKLHENELATAIREALPLPNIATIAGEKKTYRFPSNKTLAAQLRRDYEASATDLLGTQRGELFLSMIQGWLGQEFQSNRVDDVIISAVWAPDGGFFVAKKFSSGGSFNSGSGALANSIPPHLRPLFVVRGQ